MFVAKVQRATGHLYASPRARETALEHLRLPVLSAAEPSACESLLPGRRYAGAGKRRGRRTFLKILIVAGAEPSPGPLKLMPRSFTPCEHAEWAAEAAGARRGRPTCARSSPQGAPREKG